MLPATILLRTDKSTSKKHSVKIPYGEYMLRRTRQEVRDNLTHEYLTEILDYNPDTGVFTWKVDNTNQTRKGDIAGNVTRNGYVDIGVLSGLVFAHILAWFYVTKEWPNKTIDHKNQVRHDNRFENLRLADYSQQQANTTRKDNTSGYRCVYYNKKSNTWYSVVGFRGEIHRKHGFNSDVEAYYWSLQKRKELHESFVPI
ncbi:putative host cell division inhibitor Icd-like protein [Aeromonas phage LAh_9]|uniref:Putative host cell division inhibitor Icd-like protein n=2 Tax=Lahexavirus TaxID=2843411 RepID=A0A514A0V6_9CAUD|nr:putative endonuclease [Aeromonas phage LAh_8]YP_009847523.1 putative host cell division inhibitor Icd-like protein [Aeromonas phage LAh_9]QDH46759.1 putative endonuclease [Aeromonas phage LAh_8]QDH46904.1 putative host cell division inhibitor Icd-like protein [Aeromonas phage LAh_9]